MSIIHKKRQLKSQAVRPVEGLSYRFPDNTRMVDLRNHSYTRTMVQDVSAREVTPFPYLMPIQDAKQSRQHWRSFFVGKQTSRLPLGNHTEEVDFGPAFDYHEEDALPLEKPHAIVLGLCLLVISLGLLGFVI